MNRLRQPGDSDYDVLGVSPGATDEEINYAFRQLIDGEGYRVGIPLNRQWLRAHQIKAAHASLSDPAKRRASNGSQRRADRAPRVKRANDPAADEMALWKAKSRPARPIKTRPAPVAVVSNDAVRTSSGPERAPDKAPRPGAGATAKLVSKAPPSPDLSSTLNKNEEDFSPASSGHRPVSVRSWGAAILLAFGLGLVLITSWLERDRQPSPIEKTPGATPAGRPASGTGRGNEVTAQEVGELIRGDMADAQSPAATKPAGRQPSPIEETPGATPAGQPASGAGRGNEVTAQEVGELIPGDMADAQSPAATKPAGKTASAAKASLLPAKADKAQAIASYRKPLVTRSHAIKNAGVAAVSPSNPVGSAPQWIGGGPTDADNRRSRYQGTVALQVNVKPSGRVSNCAPVRGSGNAGLDARTCRLVRERARFTPARDSRGRPVVGQAYLTFVWDHRRRN